jgi:hypothetical protein
MWKRLCKHSKGEEGEGFMNGPSHRLHHFLWKPQIGPIEIQQLGEKKMHNYPWKFMKLKYTSFATKDHHVEVPFPQIWSNGKNINNWVVNITNNIFFDSIQFCECNNINLKV